MADEATTQPNPPENQTPAASPQPAETQPNPLQQEVEQLKTQMQQQQQERQLLNQQLEQYQVALGNARQQQQQQAAPAPEPGTQFDDDTQKFVKSTSRQEASNIVNQTVIQLMANASIQQKLQAVPDADRNGVTEDARKRLTTLQQNPIYGNQPQHVLEAMAVDEARLAWADKKIIDAQERGRKEAEEFLTNQNTTSLPGTSTPSYRQASSPNDPDADVKEYENQPESQEMFRKMMADVMPIKDPFSTEQINFMGERLPIKDLYRRVAVQAVRKGSALGGASGLAISDVNQRFRSGGA